MQKIKIYISVPDGSKVKVERSGGIKTQVEDTEEYPGMLKTIIDSVLNKIFNEDTAKIRYTDCGCILYIHTREITEALFGAYNLGFVKWLRSNGFNEVTQRRMNGSSRKWLKVSLDHAKALAR